MSDKLKVGYLPLTKANWTNDSLENARAKTLAYLKSLPGVEVVGGAKMLCLEDEALKELENFEANRPDVLVCQFLTFSLGVVPPLFAQRLKVPVILWSMKEPDPKGGRLQNNSFCAANMNAHHMYRLHIPYFHVHAEPGTDFAKSEMMRCLNVVKAMKRLGRMRIGLIGGRVPGFYTSCVNEMLLRRELGPEVKLITERELIQTAEDLTKEEVDAAMKLILSDLKIPDKDAPREGQLEKSARLIGSVMKLKDKFLVDTFAMRCWPEIITTKFYGIAVCSAIGNLTNHGYLTACEGDVYGAVMMAIGQILSNDLPFFCDMIVMEGEYGVAWHCGAAPCGLAKPGFQPEVHCSATIEGGGVKGCTGEFPLKPGRVTLARLGEKRDGDGFRMLAVPGLAIDTDLFVRGTPLKIKFDAGCDALRKEVIENGWEHHYALMYGDQAQALSDLCRNLNIEFHLVK